MSTQQKVSRQQRALAQREQELEKLQVICSLPEDRRPPAPLNARGKKHSWGAKRIVAQEDVQNLRRKLNAVPVSEEWTWIDERQADAQFTKDNQS